MRWRCFDVCGGGAGCMHVCVVWMYVGEVVEVGRCS